MDINVSNVNVSVEGISFGRTDLIFQIQDLNHGNGSMDGVSAYEVIVIKEDTKTLGFTILLGEFGWIYGS